MKVRELYVSALLLLSVYGNKNKKELLSVVTIYRHGDRTPIYSYPTDPYDASYWPIGYGQLTNRGKMQLFELGKWFRKRYDGFLPDQYNISDIYVRSTDVDRSIMSAQACLAGLYPPKCEQVWHKSINWQPIPVHTVPASSDGLLYFFNCPKHTQLVSASSRTGTFKHLWEENADLIQYVADHARMNITAPFNLSLLYDTLHVEKQNGLKLPKWTKKIYKPLVNLSLWAAMQLSWTREEQRLLIGQFFANVIGQFNKTTNGDPDVEKLLMYSSHDITIISILNVLRKFDWEFPPYAACLIFELTFDGKENYVDITYKKESELKSILPDNCNGRCTLNDFMDAVEDVLINEEEWRKECFENA